MPRACPGEVHVRCYGERQSQKPPGFPLWIATTGNLPGASKHPRAQENYERLDPKRNNPRGKPGAFSDNA